MENYPKKTILLALVLTFQLLVISSGQDGDCPLTCMNDSVCKPGSASFEGQPKDSSGNALDIHSITNIQNFHCECTNGFTGVACAVPYDSCADADSDHVCYHGGTCIPGQRDDLGNDQYYCDCSNAISHNGTTSTHYVGKYCEYEQESVCEDVDDANMFCVNDGVCTGSACVCSTGFTGVHCQYSKKDAPSCDLQCKNNGKCQIGLSPSGSTSNDPNAADFQFCQCPQGFLGALCEIDANGEKCGLNQCYHGSKCVRSDHDGSLYCDCSASNETDKHYAGQFCEYAATTYCTDSKEYFCVNHGECVKQGKGTFSCKCPTEWTGPSCEFESVDREHVYTNCTLTCSNGGECRKGAKDFSSILGVGPELSHLVDTDTHSENFEHCVCPKGFTGSKCEHQYVECGNGEHICLHGSKCIPPDDGDKYPVWTCDCEQAFREDHKYSGEFCQHHHTTLCTTSDTENRIYQGAASLAFCVNDGVCIEIEDGEQSRPGCKCPEQYSGMHCELLKSNLPKKESLAEASGKAAIIFACLVLSILLVAFAVVVVLRTQMRPMMAKKITERMIESSHIEEDAAAKEPMMEEIDFNEPMEDIELL